MFTSPAHQPDMNFIAQ